MKDPDFLARYKEMVAHCIKESGYTWKTLADDMGYRQYQGLSNKIYRGTLRIEEERDLAKRLGYQVCWLPAGAKVLADETFESLCTEQEMELKASWGSFKERPTAVKITKVVAAWSALSAFATLYYMSDATLFLKRAVRQMAISDLPLKPDYTLDASALAARVEVRESGSTRGSK